MYDSFTKLFREGHRGYSMIKKVERWVKKHPEAKIVKLDDYLCATSSLILIPVQSTLMMVFTPQFGQSIQEIDPPTIMNLNASNVQSLIESLTEIKKDLR